MNPFSWIREAWKKWNETGRLADQIRDQNSETIKDLALGVKRGEYDPNVVAESLDSVSLSMTMRLKGDTDKAKKETPA